MFLEEKIDLILSILQTKAPAAEEAAPKKTRGRPAKGEVDGVATASAAAPVATPEATAAPPSAANTSAFDEDPFAEPAPAATIGDVRTAILALRDATDQATALGILKKHGASSFQDVKPGSEGLIVRDAKAALPKASAVDDPFADTAPALGSSTTAATPAAANLTLDDVKKAIVAAQKRTSTDAVQKVVMAHGGVAPGATGVPGPSLKNLPADKFAATIAAIAALPSTK